jgi:hypothetical protein
MRESENERVANKKRFDFLEKRVWAPPTKNLRVGPGLPNPSIGFSCQQLNLSLPLPTFLFIIIF